MELLLSLNPVGQGDLGTFHSKQEEFENRGFRDGLVWTEGFPGEINNVPFLNSFGV